MKIKNYSKNFKLLLLLFFVQYSAFSQCTLGTTPAPDAVNNSGAFEPYSMVFSKFISNSSETMNYIGFTKSNASGIIGVIAPNSRIKMGLYSDNNGKPDVLLAQSNATSYPTGINFSYAGTEINLPLVTPYNITAGTTYHIAIVATQFLHFISDGETISDLYEHPFGTFSSFSNISFPTNVASASTLVTGKRNFDVFLKKVIEPTANSQQSIATCLNNPATITSIVATGTSLKYYAVATGGAPLPNTTELINNIDYFVTQTDGGCESKRTKIRVNLIYKSAPFGLTNQEFCMSGTIADLQLSLDAGGSNLQWFTNANGSSALPSNTPLSNATTYYASQDIEGCQSLRKAVNVTVTPSSDNITNTSACDTYTWANNGQTYTNSGIYTGTTSNCVTEKLNLTITPTTSNTTSASACDSYTWSVNEQTYTESGTYTVVNNCHTEELVLTITPNTTNTTTASACGSYTWSVNEQTYTESGMYTVVDGCHTEELELTITPTTSNITTASACDSYTWSVNEQTYTESGTYTVVDGCHTEELVLTITPNTTNTSSASACDSYTWAINNQNYTESGTYTVVEGCHTEELELTITPTTSNTITASACGSYTWAVNEQTYTQSGTYSVIDGCHTEELALTITPNTTNTSSASACDSFTWAVNNQNYTESGTYTVVNNCHTEELVLTITPNTTNTSSASACDSYTWSVNEQTYTESGTYVVVDGCHTEELVLTITPTTSNTTTASACDSYTWSVNEQTYTESGTYVVVDGCHTEELVLTITPTTSNTTTASACGSYTWAVNEQTYTESGTYTLIDGCHTEELVVTINTIAAPTVTLSQTFSISIGATVANLIATGTAIQWYASATGGTALETSTTLEDGTYYVSQTLDGCESSRVAVAVTISNNPSPATILSQNCGTTLNSATNYVYTNLVANAQGYRFRVTDIVTNQVEIKDYVLRNLRLFDLIIFKYNNTYAIEISVKRNNVWSDYSSPCNVTTPIVTTQIQSTQCGSSLNSLSDVIYANIVQKALGYRFKITNVNGGTPSILDRPLREFRMNLLQNIQYNTTYSVEVAVKNTDGTYLPYGALCTITTPGAPATTKQIENASSIGFIATSYPNPYSDSFKLEVQSSSNDDIQVRVYDMLGKLIENKQLNTEDMNYQEIGTNYISGVYNVIITQGQNTQSLRVIKR